MPWVLEILVALLFLLLDLETRPHQEQGSLVLLLSPLVRQNQQELLAPTMEYLLAAQFVLLFVLEPVQQAHAEALRPEAVRCSDPSLVGLSWRVAVPMLEE